MRPLALTLLAVLAVAGCDGAFGRSDSAAPSASSGSACCPLTSGSAAKSSDASVPAASAVPAAATSAASADCAKACEDASPECRKACEEMSAEECAEMCETGGPACEEKPGCEEKKDCGTAGAKKACETPAAPVRD